MKNFILIFLLAFSCSTFAQTIRRCNNNPGATGVNVYTTIQAAHDAAAVGDIIYVEPSVTDYGGLNATKRLTIVGTGYFLDQNINTPSQKAVSKIGNITFGTGSALSQIIGISTSGISLQDNNILVTRCYVTANGINYISGNNCAITKCLFQSSINNGTGLNTTISQNIISVASQWAISGMNNAVINGNTIYSQASGYFGSGNPLPAPIQNSTFCTITNNIFDFRDAGVSAQTIGCSNQPCSNTNSVSNNICLTRNGLPNDNGNINGANANTTFQLTNPWLFDGVGRGYFEKDAPYQLATGSPAIGIGTGGTNAGAFGGANPYVLSGLPPYPIITNFITSGVGNSTTPLNVSITVRGNN